MFEVGFSEILVIFVLALVVLGPEKLPRLAAQAGRWIGRARAMAKQFRDQLEEEINVSDFNKAQAKASASTSSEPPPAAANPDPAASAHTSDSAQAHETPVSAGTPEDDTVSHGHNSGPPAEPESDVYQPPAYANATGANTTGANGAGSNGAHPTTPSEPGTTSPQPVESAHAEPHPNHKASHDSEAPSDERPARPGDVITHTHERGI